MPTDLSAEALVAPEFKLAIEHHQAGDWEDAERCYLAVLQSDPNHALANHNMGVLLVQKKRPAAALSYLMKALEAEPARGQFWTGYIDALYRAGHVDAAKEVLAMARQQGLQGERIDELAAMLEGAEKSLAEKSDKPHKPPSAKQARQLAELFGAGLHREAETLARTLTANDPGFGFGWKVLGAVTQKTADALLPMQKAAELLPNDFEVHYNLGLILQELGRQGEACESYRHALRINPDYAPGHNNLGVMLQAQGLLAEAEASYRRAIKIDPAYVNALHNLGIVLQAQDRAADAEAVHRRTLAIRPDHADAHCNLGTVLLDMGRLEDAAASYRKALQLKPDFVVAHNNLIFCMDMSDMASSAELQSARTDWAKIHAAPLWQDTVHANDCTQDRRLRIGYVSADFREHSASKVFGGMLTGYDRSQFEVYVYSNSAAKDDRYTELFRKNATVWRNIFGVSDQAAASMIRDDRIDILVDLSGHTAGNRLLVFARKPAPIQITALGYAAGTGMQAMDVFFTDRVMVPDSERGFYREEVRYLPCALGLFSMDTFPEVNALPASGTNIVTFGSFNRMAKVSDSTWRTWSEVLHAIPNSRLLLKSAQLDDAAVRQRIAGHFVRHGIGAERIQMQGKTSWHDHMLAYHRVDIALDPFPHGGGVTALEGLMMGVPVVTRRWPTLTGRISASVMTTLGLTDWIAESDRQYVETAIGKAGDLQSLSELRGRLRGLFTHSVLGDQAAFIRSVEQEYGKLWRDWCASMRGSR